MRLGGVEVCDLTQSDLTTHDAPELSVIDPRGGKRISDALRGRYC